MKMKTKNNAKIAAEDLVIVYENSRGHAVETSFDIATLSDAPTDATTGELLEVRGFRLEEDGELYEDTSATITLVNEFSDEAMLVELKDYLEAGVFDPFNELKTISWKDSAAA